MNEMIIILRKTISYASNPNLLISIVMTLFTSLPVAAHGPGLDEINRITTQIDSTGENAALYAKRARVYQNNHMWQEAMFDFDRAAELDWQNLGYDLDRAQLSYEAGEFLRALDFINLYLLRHNTSDKALLIRARFLPSTRTVSTGHRILSPGTGRFIEFGGWHHGGMVLSNLQIPGYWLVRNKMP